LQQWVRENVGTAAIDVRDGRRVVDHADDVIRISPGWLADHSLGDVIQPDGGLQLDSAGHYRYAHRYDLGDGFHVYERC
jgi:hypothetical protein